VPEPLGVRSAAVSECGRRSLNEDAVLVAPLPDGGELVAVADGMGGLAAGDVASQHALRTLHAAVVAGAELQDAVLAANAAVLAEAQRRGVPQGMGTTLVALLRRGDTYHIVNVGDSRAYRVDAAGVRQLTQDHSFLAEAVHSGRLSFEEASRSRWKNAVTRAIGTEPELQVDCLGPFDAGEPHAVVLCTDGLYRAVSEDVLAEAVRRGEDPVGTLDLIMAAALDAGADDNVSAALVRFGAGPLAAAAAPQALVPAAKASAQPVLPQATPAAQQGVSATLSAARPAPPVSRLQGRSPHSGRRSRRSRGQRRWHIIQAVVVLAGLAALAAFMFMLAALG
jgi:PPM family protein phosphatase